MASSEVQSLWPKIDLGIVSPVTALKAQAALLAKQTEGILRAEVTSSLQKATGGPQVVHTLHLIAPLLEDRRTSLLQATHKKEEPYPVEVTAACYRREAHADNQPAGFVICDSYGEFISVLRHVLNSDEVTQVIEGMIVLSKDAANETADEPGEPEEAEIT